MYTMILFVIVAVLGYFAINAARHGRLNSSETGVFAVLFLCLAGYLIFLIVRVF
jgi:hypothetical protein